MLLAQTRIMAAFLASVMCCATGVRAQDEAAPSEKGHGSTGFRLSFYNNGDSGDGNPFLDEALTVIEPVFLFDYNVSDKTAYWAKLSYDYVSSASIDRLNKFPDQSGATGDYYVGVDVGWRHKLSADKQVGAFGHVSKEYDYTSVGFGGNVSKTLNDRGATVKWSGNAFVDQVDIIRFNGKEDEGTDTRLSLATTINWYQIMSPVTHGDVGVTLGYQDGFLETAYNAVVIEDVATLNPNLHNNAAGREVTEELPDTRLRAAVFGRVRHYLPSGSSVELGGRLYADDWGIAGVSVEPRYYRWLVEDELKMRLRYRFYTQTAADDYEEQFLAETPFRTQDSDLADFQSNTGGVQFEWFRSDTVRYDASIDYVIRSDGLDQFIGSFGYRRSF